MKSPSDKTEDPGRAPYALVLGICQDGGHPHPGCARSCCEQAWDHPNRTHHVACLGIVDPNSGQNWLFDATPDFPRQLMWLQQSARSQQQTGIFLTHAHMGHVTGLSFLGREALNAQKLPVWAMPRLSNLLCDNQPHRSLIDDGHIQLAQLSDGKVVELTERLRVTPFLVPHRDELSETVGLRVQGPNASLAYVPDCDSWDKWTTPVEHVIAEVDFALFDGTFFSSTEPHGRDPSEVQHPTVLESMERFAKLSRIERSKVHFIHLNHTNPLLDRWSEQAELVATNGFRVARELELFGL